jgi:flagellar assembly protein FliH
LSEHYTPDRRARGAAAYAALRPAAGGDRALSAWQRWEMTSLGERIAAGVHADADVPAAEPAARDPAADALELERLQHVARQAAAEGRREGWAQGHAQGLAEGHTDGLAAGLAAASAHAEQLRALVSSLPEALRRADAEIADALLALALDIARQVVHRSLRAEPEGLVAVVRELLHAEPVLQGSPRLLLHPDDVALVRNGLGSELETAGWQVCADDTLSRGGCRVQAGNGERDATVETRWARVTAALGGHIDEPRYGS